MGMSMHVVGIRPADEKWQKMKQVWDACIEANISPPAEVDKVDKFFNGDTPDDKGVLVEIRSKACTSEYNEDMREGIEVDISKLPKDVKIVRFYCSW
jgi:hypothetical protein